MTLNFIVIKKINPFFTPDFEESRMKSKNILPNPGKNSNINKEKKIELLSCQNGVHKCEEHLEVINKSYIDADNHHLEKDYLNSIGSLKEAYNKSCELKDKSCLKCAEFFRSTITNSLENINQELSVMTTGMFGKKRYQKIYAESCNTLEDFKNRI